MHEKYLFSGIEVPELEFERILCEYGLERVVEEFSKNKILYVNKKNVVVAVTQLLEDTNVQTTVHPILYYNL